MTTSSAEPPNQVLKQDAVFIVWRAFQGRVEAMQDYFGYTPLFIGWALPFKWLRPLEYLLKGIWTWVLLARRRPQVIWAQSPPTPPLYAAMAYGLCTGTPVVADCHNKILKAPWVRTPGLRWILRRAAVVLVHNSTVYKWALRAGFPHNLTVLETRPSPPRSGGDLPAHLSKNPRPWLLYPVDFSPDEPFDVVMNAARRRSDLTFLLTGDTRRAGGMVDIASAPLNLVFTGWLSTPEYQRLLQEADVVLALTILEGVEQSVASEALGYGKAMVISDTETLRELFPGGAVYVQPDAEALLRGIDEALDRRKDLEIAARQTREAREASWIQQAEAILERLDAS